MVCAESPFCSSTSFITAVDCGPRTLSCARLGYFTEAGWTGVILFFALSGFLITGSLWDSREERDVLRNFYTRRVLRIFPLYYAVVLIALLASIARGTRLAELTPVLLYAGFLQNLPGLVSTALLPISPLPLFHLWSLAVEEQFYIVWPALILFSGTRIARAQPKPVDRGTL